VFVFGSCRVETNRAVQYLPLYSCRNYSCYYNVLWLFLLLLFAQTVKGIVVLTFPFSVEEKNCVTPEKDLLIVIQQIPISKMSCFCYTNCVYSLCVLILCQRFPGQ